MTATRVVFAAFVGLTLSAALMLSIAPLPDFMHGARPLWLALVLSFWVFELPYTFKISLAWLFGLAQDVLYGTLFGMHALFLVFVVYAVMSFQARLQMFPQWQQALFLTLLFGAGQLAMMWLTELTGSPTQVMQYVLPALISGLLWPWVYMCLKFMRKILQI